jgi:hypothetical protein
MNSSRKTSLAAGILYLLTFISIPTLSLYHEIHQPSFISSSAPSSDVVVGGMLEFSLGVYLTVKGFKENAVILAS